jgi:hypothetical protein
MVGGGGGCARWLKGLISRATSSAIRTLLTPADNLLSESNLTRYDPDMKPILSNFGVRYSFLMVFVAAGSFLSGRAWACHYYLGHLR